MKKLLLLIVPFLSFMMWSCEDDDSSLEALMIVNTKDQIKVGETKTYNFTWGPNDVDKPEVLWTTSNKDIATVSDKGVVTAKSVGKCKIKVSAKNNETIAAEFEIEVLPIEVKSITFSKAVTEILGEKTGIILDPTVLPDNATDKTITWTSSDENVVTISASGELTVKGAGEATITAKNGDVISKHTVKVTPEITFVPITTAIIMGQKKQIEYTIKPASAASTTLTWISDNVSIMTVDDKGEVTSKGVGQATITVTGANGLKGEIKISGSPVPPPPPPF